jgi:hypothetical protein
MIKKLFLLLILLFPVVANAALFGASSYEECMADGKVGRTNAELQVLRNKCEKQFPKLAKLYGMKDSTILCLSSDNSAQDTYKISKNYLITESGKNLKLDLRTADTIILKSLWAEDNVTKKPLPTTLTIKPLNGSATIEIFETKEFINPKIYYMCTER